MLLKIRGCKNREDSFYHNCWLNANIPTTTATIITSWISHNIKTPSLISWKDCQRSSQGKKRVVSLSCCNWACGFDFGLCFAIAYEVPAGVYGRHGYNHAQLEGTRGSFQTTLHRMQMKQRNTVSVSSILHVFSPSSATETELVKSFKVIQISNKLLWYIVVFNMWKSTMF